MTAGDPRSTAPRPDSVVRATRCAGVVPRAITATGVSGERPPRISASAMAARVAMPMRMTSVPPARARDSQSGPSAAPDPAGSPTRPVTTVTDDARPRWVTGMPATAGTPKADVTPGTTSQGIPACCKTSTSSPPRPKRNGSPPFSRTTTAARRPCSTRSRAISSWRPAPPSAASGSLPTSISSASGGTRSSTAALTRRSWRTTSARDSSAAPRRVSSPGSPGPAPTRYTVIAARRSRSPRWQRRRRLREAPAPPRRRRPRGRRPHASDGSRCARHRSPRAPTPAAPDRRQRRPTAPRRRRPGACSSRPARRARRARRARAR